MNYDTDLALPDLRTALTAARRGWWVFPVEPYDKTPYVESGIRISWSEAATNDIAEIRRRGWPKGANVGIACGPSGLLIVDPDQHGRDDGVKAFTELCRQHEPDGLWPDTYITQTPTRGFHLYFNNPGGRYGNSRGGLPRGIDVRGDGGYVLAAGSVVDRRAYPDNPAMQDLVGNGRAYTVWNDAPVADPPAWLTGLLDRGAPPGLRPGAGNRPLWAVKIENPRTLRKRLEGAVSRLANEPEGNRNELAFWAACTVGEAVAAGRVELGEAEDDLMAAMEQNGYRADKGDYRAISTIRSGFRMVGAL